MLAGGFATFPRACCGRIDVAFTNVRNKVKNGWHEVKETVDTSIQMLMWH